MTIISFLYSFSLSLRCTKSSFGSYFCPFIVVLRNKTRTGNKIVRTDSANIKSCFISAKQLDF